MVIKPLVGFRKGPDMKIEYELANGEIIEIEVDDALGEEIALMEKKIDNRNRAEGRRHKSFDCLTSLGMQFKGDEPDPLEVAAYRDSIERVSAALSRLSGTERRLIYMVFYEQQTITSIAQREGVSHVAIIDKLKRIYRKLEKIF